MAFPSPIPKWFWVWSRWRLGRGEYEPFGPKNPAVRPEAAPAKIPSWAYQRLKLLIYGTTLPMGLYANKGVMLRNPRGGVENFLEQKNSVFWSACNVGDHTPAEWDFYRSRATLTGIKVIPWERVRSEADVQHLVSVALDWGSRGLIVNLEVEAKDVLKPKQVANKLAGYTGQVAISTEAWLYNPPLVDWTPLIDYTVLLQIFPYESAAAEKPYQCMAHAKELGFEKVAFTYGSYSGQTPELYDLKRVNYSVYTGDDIGPGNWNKWFP